MSWLFYVHVCQGIFEWNKQAHLLYQMEHLEMTSAENKILYTQRAKLIFPEQTKFSQPILPLKNVWREHNNNLQQNS